MNAITMYEAFDGRYFTNRIECMCHDIKVLGDELQFFDKDGKRIHYIESAETLEDFIFEAFKVKTGGARAIDLLIDILEHCDDERLLDVVLDYPYDENTFTYDECEEEWYSEKTKE